MLLVLNEVFFNHIPMVNERRRIKMNGAFFYFSGTGNSRYISEKFAEIMKDEYKQEFDVHSIEEKIDFLDIIEKNSVIGFCYPIYGSCVPKIMRQFVLKYKEFLNNKKIIIFCTQLLFSGDGARTFTDLLKDISVQVILAEHFIMPNAICNLPILKVKNGDELNKIVKKADKRLYKACKKLNENRKLLRGFNPLSYLLGIMQRPAFLKMEEAIANNVMIDDKSCSACGKCTRECPMGNLYMEEKRIKSKGGCTLCYRCVNHCPKKAITVWINRKVTNQYKGI